MVKQRNEIDEKYQWDLSTIFATDQAWEEEAASLATDIKAASHYAGHLLDSAQTLLDTTNAYLELSRRLEKVYVYAHMKNDQDTRVLNTKSTNQKGCLFIACWVKHLPSMSLNSWPLRMSSTRPL